MSDSLEQLLTHPQLWRGSHSRQLKSILSTGYAALDEALHDGGWPRGATTELLGTHCGIGEWRLLLPALCRQARPWLALIGPPYLPYAPALAAAGIDPRRLLIIQPPRQREQLWCAEQALSSGSCSAVISWSQGRNLRDRDLRRLQQAATEGDCWHVLFRPTADSAQASPSALRLQYQSSANGALDLHILKQRGGWGGQKLQVVVNPELQSRRHLGPQQLPIHLGDMPKLRQNGKAPAKAPLGNIVHDR